MREGAITGQTTTANMVDANTFLIWKGGEPKNFEFRAQFRLTAQNDAGFGNSGVQYRSRVIDPANFVVGGYQADIDLSGKYAGMLYEERGRGILMQPGQKIRVNPSGANGKPVIEKDGESTDAAKLAAAYKKGEWNEIVIIAKGNHVQHFLNGTLTADVTDNDPEKAPKSGVIALQLHKGPPMTIQFKDETEDAALMVALPQSKRLDPQAAFLPRYPPLIVPLFLTQNRPDFDFPYEGATPPRAAALESSPA